MTWSLAVLMGFANVIQSDQLQNHLMEKTDQKM